MANGSKSSRFIGISCLIIALVAVVLAIILARGVTSIYFGAPDMDRDIVALEIAPGSSVNTIIEQLTEEELLDSVFWFKAYGRLTGKSRSLQAGLFEIYPGTNIQDLYGILVDADVAEREVTILEGWTLQEVEDMLVERGIATEGEVLLLATDSVFRSEFLFLSEIPTGLDIEGYVFPDTYRVFANASAEDVLRKTLQTFDARIASELNIGAGTLEELERRAIIDGTGYTLFEIVTIASILEREVQRPEDMKMVADLMNRRLELGMPLQMDSTVNYFTGKNDPGVSFTDRDTPSPYNTYLNPGLPIGPISNPSQDAIAAVLDPTPNPYLFFLTTPEGEVIYSRTNDEHVRAKNRYLR